MEIFEKSESREERLVPTKNAEEDKISLDLYRAVTLYSTLYTLHSTLYSNLSILLLSLYYETMSVILPMFHPLPMTPSRTTDWAGHSRAFSLT